MRCIVRSLQRSHFQAAYHPRFLIRLPAKAPALSAYRNIASSASIRQQNIQFDLKDADRRLQMTFTCTAEDCGHRSTHEFSARSYNHGIVLLTCPSCKNRHLIADHIGWFKESTEDGKLKTVEDLLKARGEQVKRGRMDLDGDIEYYPSESEEPPKDS